MEPGLPEARRFSIAVDSEHKATELRPLSLSSPHMRAFHLAWLSLFSCFFSTFSIPPLLPIIRQDLHLSPSNVGAANIAAFVGSILSRLAMGPACDLFGPRYVSAALSLATAPAVLATALVSSPFSFILIRFLIGFSLANFIANQFWMSSMFSGCIVGRANGVAAGWANLGAGLTQLTMPLIFSLLNTKLHLTQSVSWRAAFVLPAVLQITTAFMVLAYGQDLPDGHYKDRKKPEKTANAFDVFLNGIGNYRGWVLCLSYAYCFGVELTMDNIIATYFYERFGVDMETAGVIAASFVFANIVSKPTGGVISDELWRRFGMRGRLWGLWGVQTVAGLLCLWLGRVESLWGSVLVMCGFSFFVQAAAGLTFGVVPFVSRRSMGVILGMTGSGGPIGAVITQLLLFSGSTNFSTQTGIFFMGILMILATFTLTSIYFPQWGGMLCGPSVDDQYYHQLA